jgi:asparagine synthase (glutamine-hydrolysing)
LAAVVDGCIGAVAGAAGPLVAELSGGLDSAILASALTRGAGARVRAWVNVHAEDPESDERDSARLVAGRLGVPLTELAKPPFAFTETGLRQAPAGLRPSLNGLDDAYDLALAELCREAGARTLLTGQGGDAVFLQMVTPLALLDRRGHPCGRRALTGEALAIARGSRRSLWSVAGSALGARLRPTRRPHVSASPFLAKAVWSSGAAPHPWLDDLQGLDPAKRLHVRALVHAQLAYGESRRGRAADLVHPLLSQPLVETCLGLPVSVLAAGGRGRALARAAFRERLPPAVVDRRAKGDLTAHYGRAIARSLTVLRPFLLEGRLAAEGLLEREALEAALSPEHLIWRGGYAAILQVVVMETWVRGWAERLETHRRARRGG